MRDPVGQLVDNGAFANARAPDDGDRLLLFTADERVQIVDGLVAPVGPFELTVSGELRQVYADPRQRRRRRTDRSAVFFTYGRIVDLVGRQREFIEVSVFTQEFGQRGWVGADLKDLDPLLGVEAQFELRAFVDPLEVLFDQSARFVFPSFSAVFDEDVQVESRQPDSSPGRAGNQGGKLAGDLERLFLAVNGQQFGHLEDMRLRGDRGRKGALPTRMAAVDEVADDQLEVFSSLVEVVGEQFEGAVAEDANGIEPASVSANV